MSRLSNDTRFLVTVLALVSLLTLFIVLPVLEYVLLSIILAYVLFPLHQRLRYYLGSFASAIALIATALVAIIVPIVYILWVFARDLQAVAEGDLTLQVDVIEARIAELAGIRVDLMGSLADVADGVVEIFFGGVTGIISTALQFFIGVALVLFLVFYLLRDGERFVRWLRELSPLPAEDTNRLFTQVNKTMWGSVIGHTFAALVQALIAGVGLWLAGITNVAFWTVVMAILAFLPLIGAFLIWAPAAAYLIMVDQTVSGIFLFVYGISIVSMVDYYARPMVIDREARLNPGVILIGVFGGIFTFGFVGLFVGPIVIGILAATLETLNSKKAGDSVEELQADDEPEDDTDSTLPASGEPSPGQ